MLQSKFPEPTLYLSIVLFLPNHTILPKFLPEAAVPQFYTKLSTMTMNVGFVEMRERRESTLFVVIMIDGDL